MKAIAHLISGIIADQMRQLLRQVAGPISLSGPVVCSAIIFSLLSFPISVEAQQRKTNRKPAPAAPSRKQAPSKEPREPELQLDRMPPDPAVEAADISITANVKARSLVFEAVPNPKVDFFGQPGRDTVWEATRENLPTPVEPGVTYRNIGIRLKITSVFSDIDRIVAEALGEVPLTDDTPISTATPKSPSISPKAEPPVSQSTSSRPPLKERP